ncbi:CPBP family intramembrane glutamic endopeptidase [Gordonia sp. NPDC003425]
MTSSGPPLPPASHDPPSAVVNARARRRLWWALGVGGALMLGAEMVAHFEPVRGAGWAVLIAAVLAACIAIWAGLIAADLGLGRASLGRGLRYAAAIVLVVSAVVLIGVGLPWTRDLFLNDRYAQLGPAILAAAVIIPLQTVVPEEVFFRGVVLGSLCRLTTVRRAVLVQAVLFGLWHVVSSLDLTAGNAGLTAVLGHGTGAQLIGVVGAVVVTAVAGAVLAWLRLRSGSLLAPIALHWTLNGVGAIGSALAWYLSR